MRTIELDKMPPWWLGKDNISNARSLRLAVVQQLFDNYELDEEQARQVLNLPLSPGDLSTVYEDACWLFPRETRIEVI